jgi:hypothetical protein
VALRENLVVVWFITRSVLSRALFFSFRTLPYPVPIASRPRSWGAPCTLQPCEAGAKASRYSLAQIVHSVFTLNNYSKIFTVYIAIIGKTIYLVFK